MKILVVSDTHGYTDKFDVVLEKEQPVDMLIHCGDVERDEDYIRAAAGCPVCMVAGNNDWGVGFAAGNRYRDRKVQGIYYAWTPLLCSV